jgi:hypothetical protein
MDSILIFKTILLSYIVEYFLLLSFIIYSFFKNKYIRHKSSSFRTFCYFSILLSSLRSLLYLFTYFNTLELFRVILYIIINGLSFTIISIIAACWYFPSRSYKCVKYDFSLSATSSQSFTARIKHRFYYSNLIIHSIGFIISMLFCLDVIPTASNIIIIWPAISHAIIGKIILCGYVFFTGLRLLQMIKKYSTLKPQKLVCNICMILVMLMFIVPIFVVFWVFYITGEVVQNLDLL